MPSQASIDVRIFVEGQPLKEYRDPNTNSNDADVITRYIEVQAGQTFGVRVKLLQGFELRSAKFVTAILDIDSHHYQCSSRPAEAAAMHLGQVGGGNLLTDHIVDSSWTGHTQWDEDCGEWTTVLWSFGALGYSESCISIESRLC